MSQLNSSKIGFILFYLKINIYYFRCDINNVRQNCAIFTIMPAIYEQVVLQEGESFSIGIFQDNLKKSTWHYHNNYEISFITEGMGKRIVADSIEEFQPGDLVFVGRNLPHAWIADKGQRVLTERTLEMVYLQFPVAVFCPQLLALPEFKEVQRALKMSERGIQIVGQTLNEVSEIMLQLPYLRGFERMNYLFRMLDIIGRSKTVYSLASEEYLLKVFKPANRRIGQIHDYLMNHFREEIDLAQLSELIHMAEGSLCRFFKMNVGCSVFEYLNKLKVDFACKLLMDPDIVIVDVCFDSGFHNLSHFNKQFRKNTGVAPSEYRKKFKVLVH